MRSEEHTAGQTIVGYIDRVDAAVFQIEFVPRAIGEEQVAGEVIVFIFGFLSFWLCTGPWIQDRKGFEGWWCHHREREGGVLVPYRPHCHPSRDHAQIWPDRSMKTLTVQTPVQFPQIPCPLSLSSHLPNNETPHRGRVKGRIHQTRKLHRQSSPSLPSTPSPSLLIQGKNLIHLIDRPDEPYCFRLQKDRVYYVSESSTCALTGISVARPNLVSLGTCFGKFSKSGKFKLHITALVDYIAQYAKFKVRLSFSSATTELSLNQVWIKPNGEMPFLYGNHVVKAHLGRITEDTPEHQGVVIFSMSDVPLVSALPVIPPS